jgi:hypothetical protein
MKQNVTTKFKRSKKAKAVEDQKVVEFTPAPVEDELAYEEQQAEESQMAPEELMAAHAESVADHESDMEGDVAPMEGDEEPEEKVVNSIVKPKYKDKYIENAKALGAKGKAARRSNWDWLSQMLATYCLSDKGKIDIGAFTDVLDANGVDHSRWVNRTKGWEGRFRMTGRVALQRKVADSGRLVWPDGTELVVPVDFVEKFKSKA